MTRSQSHDLLGALGGQRRHVLGIMAGLGDEDLRRAVLPSGWNCLGMINHLALDVELFWFRAVVGGQADAIEELATMGDVWAVDRDLPAREVLDNYRRQVELADAVLATVSLDAAPAWWPDGLFGDWRLHTNREVLLHVITETACHSGHLDTAGELLDRRQWLVLTEQLPGVSLSRV